MDLGMQPIRFPKELVIKSSAPYRVNCGGTWDLPAFALSHEKLKPSTVNFALTQRIELTISSFDSGYVHIKSNGYPDARFLFNELPFNSTYGFIFAAISHYQIHGISIDISSNAPSQSGLGGSGALLVALCAAFEVFYGNELNEANLVKIAKLAQQIESSLSQTMVGLQDQLAAAFGGVNLWTWRYSNLQNPFIREQLIKSEEVESLSSNILIGFTGITHNSTNLLRLYLESFMDPRNRDKWLEIKNVVDGFALAVKSKNWVEAAKSLNAENLLRQKLTPEMIPNSAQNLIEMARKYNCGSRFAGAGGGGCIWAIGDSDGILELSKRWSKLLLIQNGYIIPCKVTSLGVTCSIK